MHRRSLLRASILSSINTGHSPLQAVCPLFSFRHLQRHLNDIPVPQLHLLVPPVLIRFDLFFVREQLRQLRQRESPGLRQPEQDREEGDRGEDGVDRDGPVDAHGVEEPVEGLQREEGAQVPVREKNKGGPMPMYGRRFNGCGYLLIGKEPK